MLEYFLPCVLNAHHRVPFLFMRWVFGIARLLRSVAVNSWMCGHGEIGRSGTHCQMFSKFQDQAMPMLKGIASCSIQDSVTSNVAAL